MGPEVVGRTHGGIQPGVFQVCQVSGRLHGTTRSADEKIRHLACAGAWGLFPNKDALYINYNGHLPADKCYRATYSLNAAVH